MLLSFLKRPLPIVYGFIIVFSILLWLNTFISPTESDIALRTPQMTLYGLVYSLLAGSIFLRTFFAFAILFTSSLYILTIISKHSLIHTRSYLPALLFITIGSGFPEQQALNPALLSLFFIILSLNYIFQAHNTPKPFDEFFRAGFWVAIASLLYLTAASYIILVFISVILHGSNRLRSFIISLFGFITPWFFFLSFRYIAGIELETTLNLIVRVWSYEADPSYTVGVTTFSLIGILILIIIFALVFQLRSLPLEKIRVRRFHGILLWLLTITILSYIIVPSASLELLYILALPLTIIIANYFVHARNRFWPQALLIFLLVFTLLVQFFP